MQLSKILGTTSKFLTHESDIPQGSNLGPHLFNILIGDLFKSVKYWDLQIMLKYLTYFKFNDPNKLQED